MPQTSAVAAGAIIAPIIVTAEMAVAEQAWADGLRRQYYPAERNHIGAHITLMHHLAPSLESELRTQLKALTSEPKPRATMRDVYSLGHGVAIDIESFDLLRIWSRLAERFEHYLMPQDAHRPRLHITVQNKVDPAMARATLTDLKASFTPRSLEIAALACWHYRGGPWSPIARYPFRG